MKTILVILVIASAAWTTNRYVDSANGNNSNPGTLEQPWLTIAYAVCGGAQGCGCGYSQTGCQATNSNRINVGDTLFIRSGTYHEHQIELKNSGTQSSPIVIRSYRGEWPTIDGDSAAPESGVFVCGTHNGASWIIFDSLHIINAYRSAFEFGGNTGVSNHLVVKNCLIENTKWYDNTGSIKAYGYANYIDIENCRIIGSGESNANYCGVIFFRGFGAVSVINCDISNCSKGIYFKHCAISDSMNPTFRNNFIHNNKTCGMSISTGRYRVINNLIVNNVGSGIEVWGDAGGTGGSYGLIRHNTVYNHNYPCQLSWGGQYDSVTKWHGARFDTTTDNILHSVKNELQAYSEWSRVPDSAFTNLPPMDSTDYNLLWNTITSSVLTRGWGPVSYTLAAWKTAFPGRDGHSIQDAPIFLDTSGTLSKIGDFQLSSISPGYGAGSAGSNMGVSNFDSVGVMAGENPIIYTVTYNGNGNTGGTVPVDTHTYISGESGIVKYNTGNLVKTGSIFRTWNLTANGTGSTLQPGGGFGIGGASLILYAMWTPQYTLTTSSQTGGSMTPVTGIVDSGAAVTLVRTLSAGYRDSSVKYTVLSGTAHFNADSTKDTVLEDVSIRANFSLLPAVFNWATTARVNKGSTTTIPGNSTGGTIDKTLSQFKWRIKP
jgi:hypothetical protein